MFDGSWTLEAWLGFFMVIALILSIIKHSLDK